MTNYNTPIPTDDDACLRLIIELQRDAASYMLRAASHDIHEMNRTDRPRLTSFDYSGDHDDYNPAAARLILAATDALTSHEHPTPRHALLAMIADDDFIDDIATADFDTPLFAFFNIDDLPEPN